jgi:hypothetical protein
MMTLSVIATKKRFPKISKNIFAASMLVILFFSAASTSPTLVKALDEITTMATFTETFKHTFESTFSGFYETGPLPTTIQTLVDGDLVTFTDVAAIKTITAGTYPVNVIGGQTLLIITDPKGQYITVTAHDIQTGGAATVGPYILIDNNGNPVAYDVTFYDPNNPPSPSEAAASTWSLDATSTTLPADSITLTPFKTPQYKGPYDIGSDGSITVTDWDGSTTKVAAHNTLTETSIFTTNDPDKKLLFSLKNPGESLWIGPDGDEQISNVDGNDIIAYWRDADGKEHFQTIFDLNDYLDNPKAKKFDIDAATCLIGPDGTRNFLISVDSPGSIDGNGKILTGPGAGVDSFKASDILYVDTSTCRVSVWWSPQEAGINNPQDIDAISVGDYTGDGILDIMLSIKTTQPGEVGSWVPGGSSASDIILVTGPISRNSPTPPYQEVLEGEDHFSIPSGNKITNMNAMEVVIFGDTDLQLLLSFDDLQVVAGSKTFARDDIFLYQTKDKTASMVLQGSNYFKVGPTKNPNHPDDVDVDAITFCKLGYIVKYKGYAMIYNAMGYAYLMNIDTGTVYVIDLRGRAELSSQTLRYMVKSTSERPFTEMTQGPQAMFITCYNYINRTSTIELKHTTITTTYEVCAETTTTTSTVASWSTSIVYSGFISPDKSYTHLLLAGFLAILALQISTGKGNGRRRHAPDAACDSDGQTLT